ncbi:hypothetical protein [Methylocella silvestris]|uniref:hypothetical protein n=1 Tax=Methylocella silvestris TaxID=199596 RepID=UPI0011AF8242|nr:hypothetical protein [Methylocella silvestris]
MVVDGARKFLREVEGSLAQFADIDARIAGERTSNIRDAICGGMAPTLELSDDLRSATVAKAEAANRLEAARQASAALASEHAACVLDENEAKRAVDACLFDVVADEADSLAAELLAAEAEATEIRTRLHALGSVAVRNSSGVARPFPLSPFQLSALIEHRKGSDCELRNTLAWRRTQEHALAWRSYVGALAHDAAAMPVFEGENQ